MDLDQRFGFFGASVLTLRLSLQLGNPSGISVDILRLATPPLRQASDLASLPRRAHPDSVDEYNPSRRSSAPSSPGLLQASASLKIRRLYSALNLRRCAFAETSLLDAASLLEPPPRRSGASTSDNASFDSLFLLT